MHFPAGLGKKKELQRFSSIILAIILPDGASMEIGAISGRGKADFQLSFTLGLISMTDCSEKGGRESREKYSKRGNYTDTE